MPDEPAPAATAPAPPLTGDGTSAPAPVLGHAWLVDARRQAESVAGPAGIVALRGRLAAGALAALIRTPFADRHPIPAAFWADPENADAVRGALAHGWLRLPRTSGWCPWIEGFVYVPDRMA